MSANFEYNPFATEITLWVICPRCGRKQWISVNPPRANLEADTHRESINSSFTHDVCEFCGFVFDVDLTTGIGRGNGIIENIPSHYLLDHKDYFEDYDFWEDIPESVYTDFLDPHVKDIAITIDKIDVLDEGARSLLYRSLYAGIIGAFEAYLSDTLISKVMRNEDYKRKFVENSLQMQKTKFSLSEFYEIQAELDKMIVERLREIIYHNLSVVENLYKAVLNVEFQSYGELAKCVLARHDIVHRNGKDKEGNPVNVTKGDVQTLAQNISDFIKDIESQIYNNEHAEEVAEAVRALDEIFGHDNKEEHGIDGEGR